MAQRDEYLITVELTRDKLGAIGNALNEVCNGVHIEDWEFRTRIGVDRVALLELLAQISALVST